MAEHGNNQKTSRYEPPHVSEVGSEPASATTEYKRHPVYSPTEWLFESISSILALGLLIGIACIFSYMDNKPLSDWNARVSLNATISILTTACTTLLMHGVSSFIGQLKWLHFKNRKPQKLAHFETFDAASRGVWGSILLLTTTGWSLATIGAFVTIMRLAFSPFTQQVILIEQRNITGPPDTVVFGYAHNYSRDGMRSLANSREESFPQDPGMQSAIIRGLYGINTTEPFKCPGACRWSGSYISLGFKSSCSNVTEEALRAGSCQMVEEPLSTWRQCNMTTPAGLDLSSRWVDTDSATNYYMNTSTLLTTRPGPEWKSVLPDTWPEIARFAVYRSTPNKDFEPLHVNITDCSLSITVYEYTGAESNGSYFSFASRREVDFGAVNPWTFETSPAGDRLGRAYINETAGDNNNTIPALEISWTRLIALANFFQSSIFVAEWVEGNFVPTSLGLAAALIGDVPLDERFHGMATAMTDYLRYGPDTLPAYGETVVSEPFVSIRWGYFVVPIVTEGFAILFAVLSILSNRRSRQVPLWKTSSLAVLAIHHDDQLGLLQGPGKDINEITAAAAKAEVRLQ
ncbi:hypothetical protein BDW68DRAFT_147357 [Aspergillus falconensis]